MMSLKRVFFIVGITLFSLNVTAERYSVSEDSFGNLSAESVADSAKEVHVTNTQTSKGVNLDSDNAVVENEEHELSGAALNKPTKFKKISVFEQVYLDAERKEKAAILAKFSKRKDISNEYDATAVNPVDFVDGDELARSGGRKEVEKAPYFITVDVEGNLQNTFYDPVLVEAALLKKRQNKLKYTEARVYKRSDANQLALKLPDGADPLAFKLLNSGKSEFLSVFDAFSSQCCSLLPNIIIPKLSMGKSQAFSLKNEDLYYRFHEGDSRFLLLELPKNSGKDYPLRIRSFIRSFKKKSIEHGVFFPQIVTLDASKAPVRMITGPLLKYQEETWAAHGYLEGVFRIDRSEGSDERYLLVNTTKTILRQTSSIETEEPIEIIHMTEGSFELEVLVAK